MVHDGRLAAERVGNQWLVPASALRRAEASRLAPGRPLRMSSAWHLISQLDQEGPEDADSLEFLRRRARSRARHAEFYVHPFALDRLGPRVVLGGRAAAEHAGAPVDAGEARDVYVRASNYPLLIEQWHADRAPNEPNFHLHVVDDAAWPFASGQHFAGPWVAWLDLADQGDRAADTLLDRLIGGRWR